MRLVAAGLAATLMPLNSTMIAVALPDISDEFHRDPALVTQGLVTSYLIAAVVLQSPAGKLGDRIGHARMVMAGQLLVAIGALVGFLATGVWMLIVARILMGAGSATLVPSTMALSAALGPVVGGELVEWFEWPSVFAANLPVLAISVGLSVLAGTPAVPERGPESRYDWVGTALLAGGLTAIILGLRPDGGHLAVLVVVGIALLVPFVLWERRVPDPVIAFSLFRPVPFAAGAFLIALQNLAMYALIFELPLVAGDLFDLDARETGRLLVSMMLAMVVVSPVAGRLADRVGPRAVAVAGSLVGLLGVADLAQIDLTSSDDLRIPMILLGIGLGLTSPPAQTASMNAVEPALAGMAAGVSSTMRYLGGIVGVAVMSLLLDVDGSRADVISEHRSLMGVFIGALAVGLLCAVLLPGRQRHTDPEELAQTARTVE
jgi:MFS family permease